MDEPKTYTQEDIDALMTERDALKKNRDEILTESKRAKEALKNYEGVDPAEFKALKDAAVEAERKKAAAEGDFKSLEQQLVARHTTELEAERAKTSKALAALEKRKVSKLTEALAKAEAEPAMMKLLLLEGASSVKLREVEDDWEEYVADAKGNPLVADGKGTPMTIDDLVTQVLKVQYPGAFRGTGSSGGGASKSTGSAGGGTKTIAAGDSSAFISNLESIANGDVQVL